MKTMKNKKIIFLFISILWSTVSNKISATSTIEQPSSVHAMFTSIKEKFYNSPLFAGYHSSAEEKTEALQKLAELLLNKETCNDELAAATDTATIEKLRTTIAELDSHIHEQKIILGQKWTTARKLVYSTGAAAMLALGGIGLVQQYKRIAPEFKSEAQLQAMSIDKIIQYERAMWKIYDTESDRTDMTLANQIQGYLLTTVENVLLEKNYIYNSDESRWVYLDNVRQLQRRTTLEKYNDEALLQYFYDIKTAVYNVYAKDSIETRTLHKHLIKVFDMIKYRGYQWSNTDEKWTKKTKVGA